MGLEFDLQTSRSVKTNQRDEPVLMSHTRVPYGRRASPCDPPYYPPKMVKNDIGKKKSGWVQGGGSPPESVAPAASRATGAQGGPYPSCTVFFPPRFPSVDPNCCRRIIK